MPRILTGGRIGVGITSSRAAWGTLRRSMGGSFKIGRAFGIDVKVHWTFFLLLAFFAYVGYTGSGSVAVALVTAAVIVALFVCVLLHEFGHSLVAQRLGIDRKS